MTSETAETPGSTKQTPRTPSDFQGNWNHGPGVH